MTKKISIDNTLSKGWDNFKKFGAPSFLFWNFIFFLSLFTTFYTPIDENINLVYQVVVALVMFYLSIAIYQVYLRSVHKKPFDKSDLVVHPKKLIYILAAITIFCLPIILLLLASVVPFAMLITIPVGIIYLIFISIYFSQFVFLILDKSQGPIESLRTSFELMKGNGFKYFLFMACLGAINILGILCLGIGLLVTGPITEVLKAQLYVNLTK